MNITQAYKNLLISQPYYGLFLLNINKIITDSVETLAVGLSGINTILYINQTFWDSLLDDEQVAVLKHEVLHICMHHLTHAHNFLNRDIWNIAADCEINQYIKNLPEKHINKSELEIELNIKLDSFAGTLYYYKKIMECSKEKQKNILNLSPNNHDTWKDFDKLSEAEKQLVSNQNEYIMKTAAEQTIKNKGLIPGELSEIIEKLFTVNIPIFNWKLYFRRLLGTSFKIYTKKSQRKISKRFDDMSGIKIRHKHHILVGVDTSGSVSNNELLDFFSEITHIHKTGVTITIAECDTKLYKPYEYTGTFTGKVHGRGGTSFDPVIKHYNENLNKYTTLVYFTDGECDLNIKPKKNIIWVITSNGYISNTLVGKIIQIPK